jgi:soluble lytic murein transglycosylase
MMQIDRLGIFLSKPISFLLVLIYLVQSVLLVYLIREKFDLERQINYQQKRLSELQERLQIFKAVDDFQIGFEEEDVRRLADVIYQESERYKYDPMFVMAIILTESTFKRGQKSSTGARGLMQVAPFVGKDLATRSDVKWSGSGTLFEPEANIKLGTLHLFEQILQFGDVSQALIAYNVGETRLRGLIRQNKPLPKKYLNRVLDNYRMLKEKYTV